MTARVRIASDRARAIDLRRVGAVAATTVLLVLFALEFVEVWRAFAGRNQLFQDWAFYASLGQRWLDTGVMYGARQTNGVPYHVLINVDNLYPPPAIAWFAVFGVLPDSISAVLWWILPIGAIALVVWRYRPAYWAWPLMALCLAWPRTIGALVVGNSDLWSAGFVAGGLLWGWPGALGVLKPSLAPFAFVGSLGLRRRSWWVTVGVIGLISLALWQYWAQYLTAVLSWDLPIDRGLASAPLLLLPLVARLGRTRLPAQRSRGAG